MSRLTEEQEKRPAEQRAKKKSSTTAAATKSTGSSGTHVTASTGGSKQQLTQEQERRKGIPWTEEEHRLFLLGLAKFGKERLEIDFSEYLLFHERPHQVASHAQKYFIRLNS